MAKRNIIQRIIQKCFSQMLEIATFFITLGGGALGYRIGTVMTPPQLGDQNWSDGQTFGTVVGALIAFGLSVLLFGMAYYIMDIANQSKSTSDSSDEMVQLLKRIEVEIQNLNRAGLAATGSTHTPAAASSVTFS